MILQFPAQETIATASEQAASLAGNPAILLAGIALIVVGIIILVFLKKIIINSLLGAIAWAIATYAFGIQLPFLPSLIASIIFGLPGIGTMLLLKFIGAL